MPVPVPVEEISHCPRSTWQPDGVQYCSIHELVRRESDAVVSRGRCEAGCRDLSCTTAHALGGNGEEGGGARDCPRCETILGGSDEGGGGGDGDCGQMGGRERASERVAC